ncbi:hypothetical protein ACFXPN_11170 [Streptomyces griseorubiginosus]|uniref:hypothetical protein n=1 Tax=Streptomyces griseorubiginosus TaxID=67304 RepID=UPI00369030F5
MEGAAHGLSEAAGDRETETDAARNDHDVTAHVVMVKADDRTRLPRTATEQLLEPEKGEGIGPHRDEGFPLTEPTIHSWVHYREAFGEIPTEPGCAPARDGR